MILEEVFVNPDNRFFNRNLIKSLLGREVILKDAYEGWCHGKILSEGYDKEIYQIRIFDDRGERTLHYYDLMQLFKVKRTSFDSQKGDSTKK